MANRFRIYQKGKYYTINDDISEVAVISCIRTKIEAEWLCDLLNEKEEKIKELNRLKDDVQYYKTKSANLETGYLDYQNKLEPFYNLARDYNMRITDLSEAFEDLLEENNNLTSQIKKYETTLISSIQSERTSLGCNVLKNLADNLEIKY